MASTKKRNLLLILSFLVLAVVIVGADALTSKHHNPSESSDATTSGSTASTTPPMNNTSASYKDGTYSATGSYNSPAGQESVKVSVTLKSGVITNTSTQSVHDNNLQSEQYQQAFISGYKPLVVGKSIASVHLSRVSGSSLTSKGFNSALQQIETEAQA
jgi:uncharacterized protein with FMN-binding domain